MKKILLFLMLLISSVINGQTLVEYDRMETSSTLYLSAGWWTPALTAGWFNNAFVSSNLSAVIYGSGNGTSALEQDWYSLPNKTGLDPTKQYQLKFRLASYTFSSPTATTRGNDVADYVSVQVSTNGGVTYINELRITGNSNSTFPFTSTGTITHTANGVFTNSAAPTGDLYQTPSGVNTTGPSTVYLNLPMGISQVAIDIYCRVNSAGEEWWIDDVELWDMTPISLPVELLSFDGMSTEEGNLLLWKTASEHNSDYFLVQSTIDGEKYTTVDKVSAAGNSNQVMEYSLLDTKYGNNLTYYRLLQYDFDGKYTIYGPISINNQVKEKKVIKIIDLMGKEVTEFSSNGIYIEVYEDGTMNKVWR
jgi:hypothetical protein